MFSRVCMHYLEQCRPFLRMAVGTVVFSLVCISGTAIAANYLQPPIPGTESGYQFTSPDSKNPWAVRAMPEQPRPYPVPAKPELQPNTELPGRTPSATERFISEEELQAIENTHFQGMWTDQSEQTPIGTWGQLDTSGLDGSRYGSSRGAGNVSPYRYSQQNSYRAAPSWNTYVPGVDSRSQFGSYTPGRYYDQYTPPMNMNDGMNSGTYMNNSIAPFLY